MQIKVSVMKKTELYLFCEASELQAWLEGFLGEFKGVIADFTMWKPARIISAREAMLRLDRLDGTIVFYFSKIEISGSDSEYSVAAGLGSGFEKLSISNQFNRQHKLPYWIYAYMNDGSDVFRMVSFFLRRIKKYTKTGMRLVEGGESFPWKIGRYSEGAVALERAGKKFLWSEDSNQSIEFGLSDANTT